MKKRKVLKRGVQKALTLITMILFVFVGSIDDYEFWFFPIYLGLCATIIFNIWVLTKYGRDI